MKVSLPQKELENILSILNNIIPKNTSRPCNKHIWIEGGKQVTFYATDDAISVSCYLNVETEPFCCTAPAKQFLELVKNMRKDKPVNLTVLEEGRLRVGQLRSIYNLQGVDPSAMVVTLPPLTGFHPINGEAFKMAMSKVEGSISDDDTRPILTHIYFDHSNQEGFIRAVATDGKRMSLCKIPGVIESPFSVCKKTTTLLKKLLKKDEDCDISLQDNDIFFRGKDFLLRSRRLLTDYPPYARIIDQKIIHDIPIDSEEVLAAVKRLLLMAESSKITFLFEGEFLTIKSQSKVGDGEEKILTGREIPPMKIFINGDYLVSVLSAIDERAVLRLTGEVTPLIITGEPNMLGVVMPMRG